MKNFKQIALGLIVGAMAIGFSSFTNVPKKAAFATTYYTNDGTNYNKWLDPGTPDVGDCGSVTSTASCVVQTTATGLPDSFAISNPNHYSITNFDGSNLRIYIPAP